MINENWGRERCCKRCEFPGDGMQLPQRLLNETSPCLRKTPSTAKVCPEAPPNKKLSNTLSCPAADQTCPAVWLSREHGNYQFGV